MRLWLPLNAGRQEKKAGRRLDPVDVFYRTIQGDSQRTGDWWGNDTCWRSGLDINKILLYGSSQGELCPVQMRSYFSLVDGIVGGEGEGPLMPSPKRAGVLLAGFDPLSVDVVATQVMGFDPDRVRDQVRAARPGPRRPPGGTPHLGGARPHRGGQQPPGLAGCDSPRFISALPPPSQLG
jgi:hypothetical protein